MSRSSHEIDAQQKASTNPAAIPSGETEHLALSPLPPHPGHSAQPAHSALRTRAAVYARVSTLDQEPENQLAELRQYTAARGWTAAEYVDQGVSGAKERRPALDRVIRDARRRRFDVLVCWRLDRLGRNCQGRSKIRPPWRRETRPSGS